MVNRLTGLIQATCLKVHLSNVLTDHFSNSLSEKTTNDIPMKFLQCHFKTTFLSVVATKSWNLLRNHECETKGYFHVLPHVHRVHKHYHNSNWIFYKTVKLLTRNAQNNVEFETMLCSTLLKIMAVCSVFYRKRQFRA